MSTRVSPLRFSMLRPFVLSLLLSLVVLSVASATTIVVDGDGSDWPSGALLTTSPNDGLIDDEYDLEDIYFTNNTTDLFWRVDLYGTPSITFLLYICMNTDVNPATGRSDLTFECASQVGVDFYIKIFDDGSPSLYSCASDPCTDTVSATVAGAVAGSTFEASANLVELGITSNRTIPTTLVTIEGDTPSQEDVAVVPAPIPGTTAVTLRNMAASTGAPSLLWALAASSSMAIVLVFGRRHLSAGQGD